MKRWLVNGVLVVYISAFSWGILCHGMSMLTGTHPAMYFFVWDMFCGWANYEKRNYVIGEGVSGKYYELDPAPWGEIQPFGRIGRRHYDVTGVTCVKSALNTLRHTDHESIARIYVIEENWSKKYNLPDSLWYMYFSERKDPTLYRHVQYVVAGDGTPIEANECWLTQQQQLVMASNPRVQAELQRSLPFMMIDREQSTTGIPQNSFLNPTLIQRPSAGTGN